MDPITDLAELLRLEPERLASLQACTTSDVARLVALCRATVEAEDAAVEDGIAQSLRLLPAPLRLTAKKLVFGGGRR